MVRETAAPQTKARSPFNIPAMLWIFALRCFLDRPLYGKGLNEIRSSRVSHR